MNAVSLPTLEEIKSAHKRIEQYINRTPVMSSHSINTICGAELYFKCENFQKVGAFKFRGATNAVLNLDRTKSKNGVITHSSGNHAQALALAAKMNGLPAYIVMPSNSPQVKKDAVAGYGAQITFCEPTLAARESNCSRLIEETGAEFIHPYDNFDVIMGQGTAALELLQDVPELDAVITPVGGGGLLSGTSITVKESTRRTKVFAAEPIGADDAFRSLLAGKIVPSINPDTIADGLLTSLSPRTFKAISQFVDDIFIVSDDDIINAMKLIWERMKIVVETSSATVLAAVIKNKDFFENKKIGLILSGGNVDLSKLPWQK